MSKYRYRLETHHGNNTLNIDNNYISLYAQNNEYMKTLIVHLMRYILYVNQYQIHLSPKI